MDDENGSSNYRLTREVAEVRGRLDMLIKEQESDDDMKKEIFNRLGTLEKRMAQIVLIGTLLTVTLPVVLSVGVITIETGQTNSQNR
tara:strand:- start:40 stop:300 length:261 start_codon:yes stop_codon:yes gene_type:complete